jgi:hypothetical protein
MFGRRKLTRVEMAVYAFIIAVVVAVFSSYVLTYMELAEKVAMETTVTNTTAAINIRYAMLVMDGHGSQAARWTSANPFELARTFPANYRGTAGTAAGSVDRPAWLFDAGRAELIYLPRLYSHLSHGDADEVRFRLERHPSGFGFVLAPTSSYTWEVAALQNFHNLPSN